jgi:hypothetical protein
VKKFKKTLALKKDTIRVLGAELTAVHGGIVHTSLCPSLIACANNQQQ